MRVFYLQEPSVTVLLASGMVSSSIAMLATYPIGLARTRLQAAGVPGATQYTGALDCLKQTFAAAGVRVWCENHATRATPEHKLFLSLSPTSHISLHVAAPARGGGGLALVLAPNGLSSACLLPCAC